jgi:hypothetical protein
MQDIAPFFRWLDYYNPVEDKLSPFYKTEYNTMQYSNTIYNYYIHPYWDHFGSQTLYIKVLWADYEQGFAMFELIGEWNDALYNDIMYLKNNVVDLMVKQGIYRYVFFCENVLNYHGDDDSYHQEWYDDIKEDGGWIALVNTQLQVDNEMKRYHIDNYINFGDDYCDINWRPFPAEKVFEAIDALVNGQVKRILD